RHGPRAARRTAPHRAPGRRPGLGDRRDRGGRQVRIVFYVIVALVAAGATFALTAAIHRLSLRYRLYPKLRARDVHTRPTPRLGGVAMFLGVAIALGVGALLPPLHLVYAEPGKVLA